MGEVDLFDGQTRIGEGARKVAHRWGLALFCVSYHRGLNAAVPRTTRLHHECLQLEADCFQSTMADEEVATKAPESDAQETSATGDTKAQEGPSMGVG